MQRFLVVFALMLVLSSLAWPLLARLGLGRLPGDIAIGRGPRALHLPVGTAVVLSLVLSALLGLLGFLTS
jgi:hypothetical protein